MRIRHAERDDYTKASWRHRIRTYGHPPSRRPPLRQRHDAAKPDRPHCRRTARRPNRASRVEQTERLRRRARLERRICPSLSSSASSSIPSNRLALPSSKTADGPISFASPASCSCSGSPPTLLAACSISTLPCCRLSEEEGCTVITSTKPSSKPESLRLAALCTSSMISTITGRSSCRSACRSIRGHARLAGGTRVRSRVRRLSRSDPPMGGSASRRTRLAMNSETS